MLISRTSRRISSGTVGRPPRRLDFQRQYNRNPARCQRITVSGFTIANASQTLGNNRYRPTNTNRSMAPKESFAGAVRRRTFICCRTEFLPRALLATETDRQPSNQSACIDPSLHSSIARFWDFHQPDEVSDSDSLALCARAASDKWPTADSKVDQA